ncbi:cytochrome c oxidase assembly protein [Novosphingobium subterraneum]|uniref:cytochrome c oxidase assembly protein n=1 Tax=Novosphingobium subterraneum TaxID=48936 RepID=UPI003CFC1E3A
MKQSAGWTPYCGAAPMPDELLARWNFDPALILAMLVGVTAWLLLLKPTGVERRSFLAAAIMLALLFVSPFCALTSALFSARAAHHLALTALVAPLLALAWPTRPFAAPGGVAAWMGGHALVFWFWHAPPVYGWALSHDLGYWLMQASLLTTAMMLWIAVRSAPLPAGIAALLATMVQMGLLGALLTFSGSPLYAPHLIGPMAWGLTPLEDQQLAGLLMWAPGAGLYLAAALLLLARWLERERRAALPA